MTEFVHFGDPSRFEIAMRWVKDSEPRERRPAHGGWSTGELRLTIGSLVLTRHEFAGDNHDAVRWYLLPFFEWLATNWVPLLHEERFSWRENRAAPAATAVFFALRRLIDAPSVGEQAEYEAVQGWWARHALRAADSSALFPDLVIRRLVDDVEMSWTARQPSYAPDGYRFMVEPGAATLPISEVAGPLWEALAWIASTPPAGLDPDDRKSIEALERKIQELQHLPNGVLEQTYLSPGLFHSVEMAREQAGLRDQSVRDERLPAITQLDDAVLMFGGVSPNIGAQDTRILVSLLASQAGGQDSNKMAGLVDTTIGAPLTAPFQEGYDLAQDLLDDLGLEDGANVIDMRELLSDLGIEVIARHFGTSTIRGVAVAGDNYNPAIVVNMTSAYNTEEAGRRFTLAHELFHILYDRKQARRIAHSSGPWAPPGIEKRANAFAAMLLMPRNMVRHCLPHDDLGRDGLLAMADAMEVGARALLEHLYNIDIIDEFKRDELRGALENAG